MRSAALRSMASTALADILGRCQDGAQPAKFDLVATLQRCAVAFPCHPHPVPPRSADRLLVPPGSAPHPPITSTFSVRCRRGVTIRGCRLMPTLSVLIANAQYQTDALAATYALMR